MDEPQRSGPDIPGERNALTDGVKSNGRDPMGFWAASQVLECVQLLVGPPGLEPGTSGLGAAARVCGPDT